MLIIYMEFKRPVISITHWSLVRNNLKLFYISFFIYKIIPNTIKATSTTPITKGNTLIKK